MAVGFGICLRGSRTLTAESAVCLFKHIFMIFNQKRLLLEGESNRKLPRPLCTVMVWVSLFGSGELRRVEK